VFFHKYLRIHNIYFYLKAQGTGFFLFRFCCCYWLGVGRENGV